MATAKKVGILDIITNKTDSWWDYIDYSATKKQNVSITAQTVSVWCRQMGHQVHYATYYGLGDPKAKLPDDLDVVFMAVHTPMAPLAYALSKLYKKEGTRTVIGGPHAKGFPQDCLRYFDLVVLECDKSLIADILGGQFSPGAIISSAKPYNDTPTIEERLPEIEIASFFKGQSHPGMYIPMLASVGCPYTCNFCVDWDADYRHLPAERLAADLQFAARRFPGTVMVFYDPNFAVRFDETLTIFETVPASQRSPYFIESSLSNLRVKRLQRLRDTNCRAIFPGVESWADYSNKSGVGKSVNRRKVEQVANHYREMSQYIPYLGANLILGLDSDTGEEPFELTREFILKTVPFVWPALMIPSPYGGNPLHATLLKEGRILENMPFTFYELPYLTIILKNYSPDYYMQKIVDLYALMGSTALLKTRLKAMGPWVGKTIHFLRTGLVRHRLKALKQILHQLQTDPQFLAFHSGKSSQLPGFYADKYRRRLGKYAELMPLQESRPILNPNGVAPIFASPHLTVL